MIELDLSGDVEHVIAQITLVGNLRLSAAGLQVTDVDGLVEELHLSSGVVDVVLPLYVVAGRRQDIGERAAQHGPARVADMDRTRRVHTHKFDLDALIGPGAGVAIAFALFDHTVDLGRQPIVCQSEIDESGARQPDAANQV